MTIDLDKLKIKWYGKKQESNELNGLMQKDIEAIRDLIQRIAREEELLETKSSAREGKAVTIREMPVEFILGQQSLSSLIIQHYYKLSELQELQLLQERTSNEMNELDKKIIEEEERIEDQPQEVFDKQTDVKRREYMDELKYEDVEERTKELGEDELEKEGVIVKRPKKVSLTEKLFGRKKEEEKPSQ